MQQPLAKTGWLLFVAIVMHVSGYATAYSQDFTNVDVQGKNLTKYVSE